jgi:molecular chaperone IbpA
MNTLIPNNFGTFTVGFDDALAMFKELAFNPFPTVKYPPYDIVQVDDKSYKIDVAIAGYDPTSIEITTIKNELVIETIGESKEQEQKYLHRGIAKRSFKHKFLLADNVRVKDADFLNGILTISLEKIVPETEQPRKILIGNSKKTKPVLLKEQQ